MRKLLPNPKDRGHFPMLLQLLALFTLFFALPQTAWGDVYFGINTTNKETHTVESYEVTEATASDILGDGFHKITYDATSNILTLNDVDLEFIGTDAAFIAMVDGDLQSLTVRLIGENKLTLGGSTYLFYGTNVSFITDASNPGSLTITTTTNWTGTMFEGYFSSENISVSYCDKLRMVHTDGQSTYTIQTVEPTGTSYGLTVAGTPVTSGNATDVLGNGKVSFDATTFIKKLTFTGRNYINYPGHCINTTESIEIDVETGGALYLNSTGDGNYPFYSDDDVTIEFDAYFSGTINGKNAKPFSEKCNYFFGTYSNDDGFQGPSLYFTNTGYTIAKCTDQWEERINGNHIYDINHADVFGDGSVSVTYNGTTVNFTLNNANFRGPITTEDYTNVVVDLTGVNYIRVIDSPDIKAFHRSYGGDYTLTFTGTGELRIIDKYITSADAPFTSHEYTDDLHDASANFTTGGWLKEYVTSATGDPYLRIYKGTPTSYDLYIDGTQVTSANASDVLAGTENAGKVSFEPASSANSNVNTLTLDGASFNGSVVSGLENLTVLLKNDNTITRSDTASVFNSTNNTAPLTFKHEGDATLTISNSFDPYDGFRWPLIWNFAGIDYTTDGLSLISPMPTKYAETDRNGNVAKGLIPASKDSYSLNTVTFTTATVYPLWIHNEDAYFQVTENNKDDVWTDGKVSFAPATSSTPNTLTLNGININISGFDDTAIFSSIGDLTIDIQGTNTIAVSDTASIIRSTNGGKLTITKTGTTASLRLQNNSNDSYPIYHCPVIKDFTSFELSDGLYLSNAQSDGDFGVPVLYESFANLNLNGGNSTMGLVNAAQSYSWQPRGIRDVTISTNESYPIWVAHHRETVGNGYNIVYTQITPTNKDDFWGDNVPKVSFIPASTDNGNVNTLKLNGAEITDAIFSNLANLTIEFSGANTLCKDGRTEGYIHGSNPNAIITFKALSDNSSISLDCANDHAVVEGFANVAFNDAVAEYSGSFSYNTTERRYKNNYGDLQTLTITANGTSYGIKIGDKIVNNLNYTDVFGDKKVEFSPADGTNGNILTINTVAIGGIESDLGDLTIHLKGNNTIGSTNSPTNGIKSTNDGTLTITQEGDATLAITTTTSAVTGFANVVLGNGVYLACNVPTKYIPTEKAYINQQGQNANLSDSQTKDITITSTPAYPLWIGEPGYTYTQIQSSTVSGVSFTSNTMTLDGANLTDKFIVSGLESLTIELNGSNTIITNDTTCCIRSFISDAELLILKKDGAGACDLQLGNSAVVKGFKSVTLESLNFASKTGNSINDASTKDAILTTATIYNLWVGGALVTSNNTSGTDATTSNIIWSYDAANNKLTLNNYSKTDNDGHAFISNMANLNVYLVGTNTVGPSSQISTDKAFYTTYTNATLTFSTDENNKGTLDASGYDTFCEGFKTNEEGILTGIYCNNGLGYFPSERKIEAKKSPTISFAKADQTTGDRIYPYEYITSCETTYGTSFKAPKPTFNNGYIDLCDTTKYVYSYSENGIVKFAEDGSDYGNPGKIPYGEINLLKAGTVTITCSFPGNMQNNPCSASYTLQVNKADAQVFEYEVDGQKITAANGYIDVDGTTSKWGTPQVSGAEPTLSKPDDVTSIITYGSSDNNVATVSETGAVTPKGPGTAIISATLKDDERYNDSTATYTLIVMAPATVSFANATASILNTETYTQAATTIPEGASITYSTNNTNGNVSVNENGEVTISNSFCGTVTITATVTSVPDANPQCYYVLSNNAAFQASYTLTVSKIFNDVTFEDGQNYATYYNGSEDMTLPEGLSAYLVTGTSGNSVVTSPVDYLPQNVPLLLEKSATAGSTLTNTTYSGTGLTDAEKNSNLLQYAEGNLPVANITGGTPYVLYKNEFVKATGTISEDHCYLLITNNAPTRGFYSIGDGNDGSTAIEGIELENEEVRDEWYDLQGRRIAKPTKAGLYIKNGKKMVINNK